MLSRIKINKNKLKIIFKCASQPKRNERGKITLKAIFVKPRGGERVIKL
jgi:hypothetical protein